MTMREGLKAQARERFEKVYNDTSLTTIPEAELETYNNYRSKKFLKTVDEIVDQAYEAGVKDAEEAIPAPFTIIPKVYESDYGVEMVRKIGWDGCRDLALKSLRSLITK